MALLVAFAFLILLLKAMEQLDAAIVASRSFLIFPFAGLFFQNRFFKSSQEILSYRRVELLRRLFFLGETCFVSENVMEIVCEIVLKIVQ